ncbi:MIP domain-containing protein [Cephalotus follicularis]|uniref:MIP domain-containing protein n=1 Tax=Cephalotus follicularis TaxID=3775 RepID=A0A1Q3CJB2_CEPFO|nr:MIP domain-containing protein [Cephalotus follicularis]
MFNSGPTHIPTRQNNNTKKSFFRFQEKLTKREEEKMSAIKAAIGDAVLTSMWVFTMPLNGVSSGIIATSLGVQSLPLAGRFISTILTTGMVLAFILIGNTFGGASYNPSTTVSLYAAGLKPDTSLISMAVRFPAQAAGGVGGAKAILHVMPMQYLYRLKGPSLKVDLHTGGMVEGVLTFVRNLALLVIMLRGPKNLVLQVWLVGLATMGLVLAGSGYTGPSMNPASAFGWAYVHNWHNTWELYYVYWVCPLTGAALAAWVFRFLYSAPIKQKKG